MLSESCCAPDVLLDTEDIVVRKMSLFSNLMEFILSVREIHSHFSSVTQSYLTLWDLIDCRTPGLQEVNTRSSSPIPGVYSNSCPLSWWHHPTISSSVLPFSSHTQSFPASGSSPVSQFFASVGQSIGVSTSTSVLPVNTQDWSPLGWTGWISLQSKGLSRVFSNTTVQKHQFFGAQFLYSPTLTSTNDHWKNDNLD